jgi:DNA polymerase-3 subunit delta'
MLWKGILGQDRAKEILTQSLRQERVSQAYLFYGQEGIGKQAIALAFAAALQLPHNMLDTPEQHHGFEKACRLMHPDIHLFFPTLKEIDVEDYNARLNLVRQNPYLHIDYARLPTLSGSAPKSTKQVFYSVQRINEDLKPKVQYKPNEGRYQVVILLEAHLLRTEAANAFLKILEEPSAQTIFILTSSRPEKVLPTIVSRCQRLRLDLLHESEIAQALIEHDKIGDAEAQLFARMGEGSYNKALSYASNQEMLALRESVVAFLRHAFTQNINQQADLIDKLAKLGRERLKTFFRVMLLWMHDVLVTEATGNTDMVINLDMSETIHKFTMAVANAHKETMISLIEEAHDLVERNVNEGLILLALHGSMGRAMKGQRLKLYQALTEGMEVVA